MFPAARVGDQTATGDTITGPGALTVLIGGQPAACVGDMVNGGVCTQGAIVMGSMTVLILNRPAARMTSTVTGVSVKGPVTTPISTTVMKGCPTVLIGG
jgi:uncharacterized Zn-binding protein involved in type VI secretion